MKDRDENNTKREAVKNASAQRHCDHDTQNGKCGKCGKNVS